MYPYIRSIHALLSARKLPAMALYDTHVSQHRAWPWDTDMFGELNNGRILTLFELGRWQMAVRLGIFGLFAHSIYLRGLHTSDRGPSGKTPERPLRVTHTRSRSGRSGFIDRG